jgi:hypothetical protein
LKDGFGFEDQQAARHPKLDPIEAPVQVRGRPGRAAPANRVVELHAKLNQLPRDSLAAKVRRNPQTGTPIDQNAHETGLDAARNQTGASDNPPTAMGNELNRIVVIAEWILAYELAKTITGFQKPLGIVKPTAVASA